MPAPGITASGLEIIKGALRNINVLASGEEPSGAEAQDSLVRLNQMIDAWNADGLMMFTTAITDFPLSNAKQIYTLGLGGDFNIDRPARVSDASIIILTNPAVPIEYTIPVYTTQDWQEEVPVKNVPGNLPLLVYDDGSFPLRNLTFWPVPGTSTLSFRLYSWQKLTQLQTVQQLVALPEGYQEAIHTNLAIRLAPEFGAQVSPETVEIARTSLAVIKSANADDVQLRSDLHSSNAAGHMRSELFNLP